VSEQWLILYGFTVFHLITIIFGTLYIKKDIITGIHLFEEIKSGNDALFLSMHQIDFFCGLLGICGVIFPLSGIMSTAFTERYRESWMILLSGLALTPFILFSIYWIIKNRNRPFTEWLDEKQASDTAIGALAATVIALPLIALFVILSLSVISLSAPFWLSFLFFMILTAFTGTVIMKTRKINA